MAAIFFLTSTSSWARLLPGLDFFLASKQHYFKPISLI